MLHSYCKFLKLTNGEEIIVTTDNDCKDFKNEKYLSVVDVVEVKAMQIIRGSRIMETQVMQPWIRLAKDDIIQIPTENIIVAVDIDDVIQEQYETFLYQQHDASLTDQEEDNENDVKLIEETIEQLESELDPNDDIKSSPTFH